MNVEVQGVFGLLLLIACIWAILNIVQSKSTTGKKVLWILFVLLLPLLGVIVWFFLGPKSK